MSRLGQTKMTRLFRLKAKEGAPSLSETKVKNEIPSLSSWNLSLYSKEVHPSIIRKCRHTHPSSMPLASPHLVPPLASPFPGPRAVSTYSISTSIAALRPSESY